MLTEFDGRTIAIGADEADQERVVGREMLAVVLARRRRWRDSPPFTDGVEFLGQVWPYGDRMTVWLVRRECEIDGEPTAVQTVAQGRWIDADRVYRSLSWAVKSEGEYERTDEGWRASSVQDVIGLFDLDTLERGRVQAWRRRALRGAAVRPCVVEVDGERITIEPPERHVDNDRRLHCEDGPALRWKSGEPPIYAWHGTQVREQTIMTPVKQLTQEAIDSEWNLEDRRVLIERRFGGMAGYIEALGLAPAHSDDTGELYLLNPHPARRWDGGRMVDEIRADLAYVRVRCASTDREYWLRVPPNTQRAKQGVAWTFDVPEEQYSPVAEA